eukprot:gene10181-8087_t
MLMHYGTPVTQFARRYSDRMDSLSHEEQQLMDKLRNKYATDPAGIDQMTAGSTSNPPLPASWESAGASSTDPIRQRTYGGVEAKVCGMCQGSGSYFEEYNCRRMEKFCTSCDGKGVNLYKNGKEVQGGSTENAPKVHEAPQSREEKLQSDVKRLEDKMESYQQAKGPSISRQKPLSNHDEKKTLEESMDEADAEKSALQKDLLAQLEAQLQKISAVHSKKVALLNKA